MTTDELLGLIRSLPDGVGLQAIFDDLYGGCHAPDWGGTVHLDGGEITVHGKSRWKMSGDEDENSLSVSGTIPRLREVAETIRAALNAQPWGSAGWNLFVEDNNPINRVAP